MTDTKTQNPFVPGAEVAIQVRHGWSDTRWRKAKVAKVHKTGRFTLEGDTTQWTPFRFDGRWAANNNQGSNRLEPMSPKIVAEMREEADMDRREKLLRLISSAMEKTDARSVTSTSALEKAYTDLIRALGKVKD